MIYFLNNKIKDIFEKNDELRQMVDSRILPRKSYIRVFLDNNTNTCNYSR